MSKISIVSNLQCTSIFTVRIDDDLVSVLAWEQGQRTVQYNFHPLTGCRSHVAARLRSRALGSNLTAVMRRMEYAEVPRDESDRFYEAVSEIIDGWVSDWFIVHFDAGCADVACALSDYSEALKKGVADSEREPV